MTIRHRNDDLITPLRLLRQLPAIARKTPRMLQGARRSSRSGQKPRLIAPANVSAGAAANAAYASVAPEE